MGGVIQVKSVAVVTRRRGACGLRRRGEEILDIRGDDTTQEQEVIISRQTCKGTGITEHPAGVIDRLIHGIARGHDSRRVGPQVIVQRVPTAAKPRRKRKQRYQLTRCRAPTPSAIVDGLTVDPDAKAAEELNADMRWGGGSVIGHVRGH